MKRYLAIAILLITLDACQPVGKDDTEDAVVAEEKEKRIEAADASYNRTVLENPTRSDHFFCRAAEDFRTKKTNRAAVAIREGRGAWNQEVTARDDVGQQEKADMLETLSQLAQQVENGDVFNVDRLNATFSQAELLGAALDLQNSQAHLSNLDYDSAADQGHRGLTHLAQAEHHAGQLIDRETRRLVADARTLLNKLERSPSPTPDIDILSLKIDSIQVAIRTMTVPRDEVRDVDTAYRATPGR